MTHQRERLTQPQVDEMIGRQDADTPFVDPRPIEEISQTYNPNEEQETHHGRRRLLMSAVGGLAATAAAVATFHFGLGGSHDKDPAAAKAKPVAAAPANPNHETAPTEKEAWQYLYVNGERVDTPEKEKEIFGLTTKQTYQESTQKFINLLNMGMNWSGDPRNDKIYNDSPIQTPDGYAFTAGAREQKLFPALKSNLFADPGETNVPQSADNWVESYLNLARDVGSYNGTSVANNLEHPFQANFKLDTSKALTSPDGAGYAIYPQLQEGVTEVKVFTTFNQEGLDDLATIKTADDSTFESLNQPEKQILDIFYKDNKGDGTRKIIGMRSIAETTE